MFVFSELVKAVGWNKSAFQFFIVATRIKSRLISSWSDSRNRSQGRRIGDATGLRGLECVAEAAGKSFVQGVLLYDGHQTLSFGEHLTAAPFPTLWT